MKSIILYVLVNIFFEGGGVFRTVTCFVRCIIAGPLFIWSISLVASCWLPYRMDFGSHNEPANATYEGEMYASLFVCLKLFFNRS